MLMCLRCRFPSPASVRACPRCSRSFAAGGALVCDPALVRSGNLLGVIDRAGDEHVMERPDRSVLTYLIPVLRHFLPDEVPVRHFRLRDHSDGSLKSVSIKGSYRGSDIQPGDPLTLWGSWVSGDLKITRAFNHETNAWVNVSQYQPPGRNVFVPRRRR